MIFYEALFLLRCLFSFCCRGVLLLWNQLTLAGCLPHRHKCYYIKNVLLLVFSYVHVRMRMSFAQAVHFNDSRLLKLRISNERAGGCAYVCVQACIFLCVSVCTGACWGAQAWSGVLLLHLGLCGSLWSGVDLVGLSSGAHTKPVQDYPPRDKVCDYHEKAASSSPTAKDCQACWRGGPPLISCREMLNAGAHSPTLHPHTWEHNDTRARSDTHAHTDTHVHTLICGLCNNSQVYKNYITTH